MTGPFRIERDSMGEVRVPRAAYYGAQTVRAKENFPISGVRIPTAFVHVLGMVKKAAAEVNCRLGLLPGDLADVILQAADEVISGKMDAEFVLDVFQTGSGTSTNMNANEVIANRANELLGGVRGENSPVHPNDHVNLGQSSNDVIPTAIHVSLMLASERFLVPGLKRLEETLLKKAVQFDDVVKVGRTHLQDATPIRLGQEFSGFAAMIHGAVERIHATYPRLSALAIGGTAVGTGLNTHPRFGEMVAESLSAMVGLPFVEAPNHFEAQGSRDAVVEFSGALKTIAVSLMKIANDIRWLGSGPRCGIGEIALPALQPGSSMMPGKVNPVIAESLAQVAAQVIGNDMSVTVGGMSGNFELNVMMPMMMFNALQSVRLLANGCTVFEEKCLRKISADVARCTSFAERSLSLCTALVPEIGYERSAAVAKEAVATGKTIREVVLARGLLSEKEANRLLNPISMTFPGGENME